jgi:hypothetical protein
MFVTSQPRSVCREYIFGAQKSSIGNEVGLPDWFGAFGGDGNINGGTLLEPHIVAVFIS